MEGMRGGRLLRTVSSLFLILHEQKRSYCNENYDWAHCFSTVIKKITTPNNAHSENRGFTDSFMLKN